MMTETPTLGLVLAGGLARRMGGGDKPLTRIGGKTILARVLERMAPQCARLDPQRQRRSGALCRHRPAGDRRRRAGFRRSARRHSRRPRLGGGARAGHRDGRERAGRLSVPAARSGGAAASRRAPPRASRWPAPARANGGIRWSALWPVALRADLRHALTEEDMRKIEMWTARHGVALADWPAEPVDPFFNVNTPEDAAAAERPRGATSATACLAHQRRVGEETRPSRRARASSRPRRARPARRSRSAR